MTRIELAPEVSEDIERILDHLLLYDVPNPNARITAIIEALDVLRTNPMIGRPTQDSKRELIIGEGSRGYIALYRYVQPLEIAFVLAIRSQREAGYAR